MVRMKHGQFRTTIDMLVTTTDTNISHLGLKCMIFTEHEANVHNIIVYTYVQKVTKVSSRKNFLAAKSFSY